MHHIRYEQTINQHKKSKSHNLIQMPPFFDKTRDTDMSIITRNHQLIPHVNMCRLPYQTGETFQHILRQTAHYNFMLLILMTTGTVQPVPIFYLTDNCR